MPIDARQAAVALAVPIAVALVAAVASAHDTDEPRRRKRERERRGRGPNLKGDRKARRERVRASAAHLETALSWPGLADFLDMMAHGESRWTFNASESGVGTNATLGLFQIRPTTAFPRREFKWRIPKTPKQLTAKEARKFRRRKHARRAKEHGRALMSPCVNMAAIVAMLSSMEHIGATWTDARVAMGYPIFIHGRPTFLPNNKTIRGRFPTLALWQTRYDEGVARAQNSARAVGLPESFLDEPAYPAGYGGLWRTGSIPNNPTRKSVRALMAMLGCVQELAGVRND